jgi:hypothetical protein
MANFCQGPTLLQTYSYQIGVSFFENFLVTTNSLTNYIWVNSESPLQAPTKLIPKVTNISKFGVTSCSWQSPSKLILNLTPNPNLLTKDLPLCFLPIICLAYCSIPFSMEYFLAFHSKQFSAKVEIRARLVCSNWNSLLWLPIYLK